MDEKNSHKLESSISKYASAISTISKELSEYRDYNINIYKIIEVDKIDEIKNKYLEIDDLRNKNIRGNRMYTASLSWYKKYLEHIKKITIKEYLSLYSSPKQKGEHKLVDGIKKWDRDRSIVDQMIKLANNRCEYDNNHRYFISNKTGENYVEGHHLIPIKYQDDFKSSLDVDANVVILCPVCHKLLHFGKIDDKIPVIKKIYEIRKTALKNSDLEISFDKLKTYYE